MTSRNDVQRPATRCDNARARWRSTSIESPRGKWMFRCESCGRLSETCDEFCEKPTVKKTGQLGFVDYLEREKKREAG